MKSREEAVEVVRRACTPKITDQRPSSLKLPIITRSIDNLRIDDWPKKKPDWDNGEMFGDPPKRFLHMYRSVVRYNSVDYIMKDKYLSLLQRIFVRIFPF